jgi:predicted small secreted protein
MNESLMKLVLIFAVTLGACNTAEESAEGQSVSETGTQAAPGSATGDPSVVHHPEPPARPEQKQDSIQIEGNWEKLTATLVNPTTDLRFSTYVPKDMAFEQAASGEGEGFYFYANFAGKRNDNSFMLVFVLPNGATQNDAQRFADAFTASRRQAAPSTRVQLGQYQNRWFYVAYTYPPEYGDGMGPRTHFIRKEWVWQNDGKSLESTLLSQP